MFEQLGLIGCGLMGGSFALALKKAGLVKRVVGYSKSPSTTDRARQLGVIDVEAPSALLAVAGADIVLVAVPVAATEATLKAIKHLVTPQMLIMDVGSTKADVVQAAATVTINKGDNTWLMLASALVILMSIPGLYLFTRTGLTASVLPGWDNLSSRCTP